MKKYLTLILLTLLISNKVNAQNEILEDYAKTLFSALKENNFKKVDPLMIRPSDSIFLVNKKLKIDILRLIGDKTKYQKMLDEAKQQINTIYIQGKGIGIDWSKSKYSKFEYSIVKECENNDCETILSKPTIYFSCNKKEYPIELNATIKINSKWKGFGFSMHQSIALLMEYEKIEKHKNEKQKKAEDCVSPG